MKKLLYYQPPIAFSTLPLRLVISIVNDGKSSIVMDVEKIEQLKMMRKKEMANRCFAKDLLRAKTLDIYSDKLLKASKFYQYEINKKVEF